MADFEIMPPLQPDNSGQGSRVLLTGGLCLLFFAIALHFFPTPPPQGQQAPSVQPAPGEVSPVPAPPPEPALPARTAVLKGGSLEVQVTTAGGGICGLTCLKDPGASVVYEATLYTASSDLPALLATAVSGDWRSGWAMAEAPDGRSVRFTRDLPGKVSLAKTLRIPATGYVIEGEIEIVNAGGAPATVSLETLVPGPSDASVTARMPQQVSFFLRKPEGPVFFQDTAISVIKWDKPESSRWLPKLNYQRLTGQDPKERGPWPARWAGMASPYFSVLVDQDDAVLEAWAVRKDPAKTDSVLDHAVASLRAGPWTLAAGERRTLPFRCFAGPKRKDLLAAVDPVLPEVLGLGPIDTLIQSSLAFLHGLVGNYGVAIILLTLLVRGVIHPLNRRAQGSMMVSGEKMKRLQPRLDELKKRLKNNPEKLFKEQGKLMKEEGMSPFSALGGCLPILLQMPVLWALYKVLQASVELRGASFGLWIHDLAKEDAVMSGIPFLHTLNPLPLVLICVMLYQMWKAPKPADPQMAQQQKMMMFLMPAMFGWMMYHLPSGITLYWLTSTLFSIWEQWHIRRGLVARGVIKAAVPVKP